MAYTLPETNSSHLKIGHPKRKLVFQPSIFKGYVSFREGKNSGNQVKHVLFSGGVSLDPEVYVAYLADVRDLLGGS